jgi:hypothetical protein
MNFLQEISRKSLAIEKPATGYCECLKPDKWQGKKLGYNRPSLISHRSLPARLFPGLFWLLSLTGVFIDIESLIEYQFSVCKSPSIFHAAITVWPILFVAARL